MGVAIALVLELSGVSSLAFAVGVYLPLSSTTPIFVGGLMRYVVDRTGRTAAGRKPTEAENEMGPGVLLSTGYIAGGAIGGVLIAFLSFSDEIPRQLSAWQYRQTTIAEAKPLEQQYEDVAAAELRIQTPEARQRREREIKDMAAEIGEINAVRLPSYIHVSRGTELAMPGQKTYLAEADTTLGKVAGGSERRAAVANPQCRQAQAARGIAQGRQDRAAARKPAGRGPVRPPGLAAPSRGGRLVAAREAQEPAG